MLKSLIKYTYKPLILFLLAIIVLSIPQVGYREMALQLLYAGPLSVAIVCAFIALHTWIRRKSLPFFMTKTPNEVINTFEHSKAYYAFFVVLTFIVLSAGSFLLITKIWNITNGFDLLNDVLRNKLIISMGELSIGLIEFTTFTLFIVFGFVLSSLIDKFLLEGVYDVFFLEESLRNTITSIVHYVIVYSFIVLGLSSIQLLSLVFWVNSVAAVGLGFAAKDFVSDFIAGFLVLIERPVKIGDLIQTGKVIGRIKVISARSTTIITEDADKAIIPNRELLGKVIIKKK